jgi:excisionase family DNA binding protein
VKVTSKPGYPNRQVPDDTGNESSTKELLTITEVAVYLKLSRRTTWRWCKTGQLPAFKVGHQWRVAQSDLERFIQRRNREKF